MMKTTISVQSNGKKRIMLQYVDSKVIYYVNMLLKQKNILENFFLNFCSIKIFSFELFKILTFFMQISKKFVFKYKCLRTCPLCFFYVFHFKALYCLFIWILFLFSGTKKWGFICLGRYFYFYLGVMHQTRFVFSFFYYADNLFWKCWAFLYLDQDREV